MRRSHTKRFSSQLPAFFRPPHTKVGIPYRNAADKGAIQVIAGHRGWRGADYFRHIDRLQAGDTVTLTNLWETLTYTVADIRIIQPHEVDKIKIQQGRDLLTLLTCHPYAIGGREKYVVYCEKLPTMSQSQ